MNTDRFARFALSLACVLLLCQGMGFAQDIPGSAADTRKLIRELRQQKTLNFRLQQVHDPYQMHRRSAAHLVPEQVLTLRLNKQFSERSKQRVRSGNWSLEYARQLLSLHCLEENGQQSRGLPEVADFVIKQYQAHRLILCRQGRHGWVEYVYQLVP